MKGKRYTTEAKIRILREAQSSDKTIEDVCRERQISEQPLASSTRICRGVQLPTADTSVVFGIIYSPTHIMWYREYTPRP